MATVRTFDPTPQNLLEIHRAFRAIRIQLPQSTFDATVPPTTEDDITQGWKIGSLWVDTVTHTIYQCADNVIGEAVWLQMVPLKVVVGGGVAGGGIDPGAADDINQGFSVGSLWINSVDRTVFMCYDATASAAVWRRLSVTATDRLLGRQSAGAGDVEEITCTAAGRALLDDADAAAQRTTLGLGALAVLASPLPIANGGSGQATQQAAIDALTAVSGATNEHVLTKDTATGNAVFKAGARVESHIALMAPGVVIAF